MTLGRYLTGVIQVELVSADIAGALLAMQQAQIPVWDFVDCGELSVQFFVSRKDYPQLCRQLEKRGDQLRIVMRRGLYWSLIGLRKRPVLVLGLSMMLLFSLWLPSRVLFVQVQGNSGIDGRKIVEVASRCGIHFGATRREVRSEKMKNALLQAMPELSWAGVNTYGCTAVISVREGTKDTYGAQEHRVSSIVATRDGIIREVTVLRGNGLCKAGQVVRAGQVLISGYTDCGIAMQATAAKGEVYAQTDRALTVVSPAGIISRREKQEQMKKYSLIIGKKRINFSNSSGISGSGCAKIYEQRYLTLPGGFVLPVSIVVETWTAYAFSDDPLELDLSRASRQYLLHIMCAGTILHAKERMEERDGLRILYGNYSCHEMIGITRLEESIPDHGKND